MPGPVFIEGDTVSLRTIEDEDTAFLQAGLNDPSVRRYAGGPKPLTGERLRAERLPEDDDLLALLVCVDDERAGTVSLAPIDHRRGWANLGYWIHPDHQGRGYATHAARLLIDHGFRELRLHRISATIHATNEASIRVTEKLGFTEEGRKRDDAFCDGEYVDRLVFSVLEDEWDTE